MKILTMKDEIIGQGKLSCPCYTSWSGIDCQNNVWLDSDNFDDHSLLVTEKNHALTLEGYSRQALVITPGGRVLWVNPYWFD